MFHYSVVNKITDQKTAEKQGGDDSTKQPHCTYLKDMLGGVVY